MAGSLTRTCLTAVALCAALSCGDDDAVGTGSAVDVVLVRAGGDWQRGMGRETLAEPFALRALDAATLKPVPRVPLRFTVARAAAGAGLLSDTVAVTDAEGIARTHLTLGEAPPETVFVSVRPVGGGPSERFTVLTMPAPRLHAVEPASFSGGDTVRVRGERLGFAAVSGFVRFNGTPVRPLRVADTVIHAVAPPCLETADVEVVVTSGGARTDTISAAYTPRRTPISLPLYDAVVLPAAALASCIELHGPGQRFLLIAQVESDSPGPDVLDVELQAGATDAAMALVPHSPSNRDIIPRAFERTLRARESALAAGAGARPPGAALRGDALLPALGDTDTFRVIATIDASTFTTVTARLRYFGRHILLWVDTTSPGELDDGLLQRLARVFDEELYPLDERNFGEVSDVDGNGRVHVLLTPVVNALTPAGRCTLSGFVGGFFSAHDLFPAAPNSNGGEVFYGFVPDTAATYGCPHTAGEFSRVIRTAFVHELQHVINYHQHVFRRGGPEEEVWLNEGLSHIAEELASRLYEERYPSPSGRAIPGQVFPDSAQPFILFNLINAYLFLRQPFWASMTHFIEAGTIEERGAAWLFLRWLADQHGEGILRRLVHTSLTGKANIQDKTGEPFGQLAGAFMIATYADSIPGVPRSAIPPRYRFHSRNLRALFQRLNETAAFPPFPIEPLALPHGGEVNGPLRIGGAVILTLDVPDAARSTTLRFAPFGGGAWGAGHRPQLAIFRLQ